MNNVILFQDLENKVNLIIPTSSYLLNHTLEEVAIKDVPEGCPFVLEDTANLPLNLLFYDAWEANLSNYTGVTINLDKAKAIYKQDADARAAYLSTPLTQEYMRLMAIGADTTAVQAQLKAINAAAEETAYLDATTVDELIACWPPELGPNPFLPPPVAE